MARYQILSWFTIPAGISVQEEQVKIKKHLPPRFQIAIDSVAMRVGITDKEGYMSGWQYSDPVERPGNADMIAEALYQELETQFPPEKIKEITRKLEQHLLDKFS